MNRNRFYNTLPSRRFLVLIFLVISTNAFASTLVNADSDPDIRISPLTLEFVELDTPPPPPFPSAVGVNSTPQFTKGSLPGLTAKIRNRGKADLIVGFDMISQPEGKLTATQAQQQHQDIRRKRG